MFTCAHTYTGHQTSSAIIRKQISNMCISLHIIQRCKDRKWDQEFVSEAARDTYAMSHLSGEAGNPQQVLSLRWSLAQGTSQWGHALCVDSWHSRRQHDMTIVYALMMHTGYASHHIWCRPQARINWEGVAGRASGGSSVKPESPARGLRSSPPACTASLVVRSSKAPWPWPWPWIGSRSHQHTQYM